MEFIPDSIYKSCEISGKPNYVMYLSRHFEAIAKWRSWNDDTQKSYQQVYNEHVLPRVNLNKPISEFDTDDDYVFCDQTIKNYTAEYSSEYIGRFIYLFHCVYAYGVHIGEYDDNLFSDEIDDLKGDLRSAGVIGKRGRILTMPKSLTIRSLVKIAEWIKMKSPKDFSLYEVGFIIMLLTGMRVNEVCGVTFGNLLLKCNQQVPVIAVVRSTKYKSAEHKISGKTSNADRLIPIDWFLYRFIDSLKKERIKKGVIEESLKDTPIVSTETGDGISAATLSTHIRPLFNSLGVFSKDQMISLVMDLTEQKEILDAESYIEEKDLTAYVLRRNYATMNAALGLSESELQYVFGHSVEADERERFVNEDRIFKIYKKIVSNPLYFILNDQSLPDSGIRKIQLKDNSKIYIKVEAKEPCNPVGLKVIGKMAESGTLRKRYGTSFERRIDEADILEDVTELYRVAIRETDDGEEADYVKD